ncbi:MULTISPECIES: hypothetical protein [unclassified Streptomyces]|uniref:hypothetical protein n=1 Tax=unclassified Streptomyces TaxID=2593676 RepID=UPI00382705DB
MPDATEYITHALQRIHQEAAKALADDPGLEGVIVHPVITTPTGAVPMEPMAFARASGAHRG